MPQEDRDIPIPAGLRHFSCEPTAWTADEDAGADLVAASTDERPGTLLLASERATNRSPDLRDAVPGPRPPRLGVGRSQASTTLNVYAKRRGRTADVDLLAGKMNRYLLGSGD